MAVVLRYVDKLGLILERLVGVVHVKETSTTCLKSALEKLLVDIGLSFKQVRGQCYDGASNMRGEFNGLKAKILEENRSAYYVHCFAHQIQLVIVAISKKNEDIADFFYMISLLFNVVGASCKRKDMIRETNRENVKKAISVGRISTGTGLNQDQSLQRAGLAKKLVDTKKHLAFPLVYQLLKLVLILPVATASVERCFSAMNIVKSVLRNKMGDQFMSDCLICYVEKDIFATITNDAVIDLFKKMGDREGKL
ncbi:hypothetical protein VPH35_135174 [Triticum aestivum]